VLNNELKETLKRLLSYCESSNWAGYEPYDALNSRLLTKIPFFDSKIPRLVVTQALKRSPINLRRLLLIDKTQNPKALAIFLLSFLKLQGTEFGQQDERIKLMVERLIALRSEGSPYWCWGYSFPWQTRFKLVPRWEPNLVCTAFAADALLELYEQRKDARCLEMAASAADYLLNELYFSEGDVAGFAYPLPTLRNQVHNANFLAAAILCRVYKHTGKQQLIDAGMKAARYSAAQQHENGGWDYGEAPSQCWIDNFHTGYNLCGLEAIARDTRTREFDERIRRGMEFFRAHFFREDGAVGYYHNQFYPIDAHCVAQTIITLLTFKDLQADNVALANKVFHWATEHLWDERGYFYFRILRLCKNRIDYLRWTQAWMLYSMAWLLRDTEADAGSEGSRRMVSARA
jgi:rhamnogalacturonyl hydrolase YesR